VLLRFSKLAYRALDRLEDRETLEFGTPEIERLVGAGIAVNSGDTNAVELGVMFQASTNGTITGIRVYPLTLRARFGDARYHLGVSAGCRRDRGKRAATDDAPHAVHDCCSDCHGGDLGGAVPVDEIVTAPGKLITTRPNLVVQPLDTSVIREIRVAVGDVVKRGQALATLDQDKGVGSRLNFLETQAARLEVEDVPLQAEVNVDSKDIGEVAVGQPGRLKFEASPFQKYGMASGVVRVITQDSFMPEAGAGAPSHAPREDTARPIKPYYRVLVDLTDTRPRGLPKQFKMLPGMTLTAEVKVGSRRVIS
jgi:hypothetical protein